MSSERKAGYFNYFTFGLGTYVDKILLRIRREAYETFMQACKPCETSTVLDVGVSADDHPSSNYLEKHYPHTRRITALSIDVFSELEIQFPGLTFVQGDGRSLPFADNSFDFVFSHAVIEHVGTEERQAQYLQELARVAKEAVVFTTPNRLHPIESHTGTPFFHYLPKSIHLKIYGMLGKKMYSRIDLLNLLTPGNLKRIFRRADLPDWSISIKPIYWLGIPSNLVAVLKKLEVR